MNSSNSNINSLKFKMRLLVSNMGKLSFDEDKLRWAVQLDQRRLSIKASNLELIDSHSDKEALGRRFVDRALKLGYMDPRRSSHAFGALYARASAESEGANLYFTQLYEMDFDDFDEVFNSGLT